MKKPYCFDPKCLELAEHFLPSDAPETADLAQWIQDQVELWLESEEALSVDDKVSKGAAK